MGERFKSYTPHAKERHGKGRRLSGLAGGKPLLLCLQSRDKHAPFTKLYIKMASAGADTSPWHAPPTCGALVFHRIGFPKGCALAPAIKNFTEIIAFSVSIQMDPPKKADDLSRF